MPASLFIVQICDWRWSERGQTDARGPNTLYQRGGCSQVCSFICKRLKDMYYPAVSESVGWYQSRHYSVSEPVEGCKDII